MEKNEAEELRAELSALRARVCALESRPGPAAPTPPPFVATPAGRPPAPEASQSRQAGNALGVVAVVCFVLAATFLIKLAVDSGWLTPARQLGLAALLGGALIGAGLMIPRREGGYAGLLPAAGVVTLYLAAYGGNLYYGLYGSWEAAVAASAISALALLLLRRFQSEILLGVAAVGTYACPLLLPALKGASFDSMVFFLVWDAAFVAWAVRAGNRLLPLLACYLAMGAFAVSSPTMNWRALEPDLMRAAGFQFVQFALFLGGIGYYSVRRRQPLTTSEAWAFFPVLLFFYSTEYSLITRISAQWAPRVALAFAGIVYGVYLIAGERLAKDELGSAAMVNAFAALVLFHALYLQLLPARFWPWCAVALLAAAALRGRSARIGGALWPFGAAALIVVGTNFLKVFFGGGGLGYLETSVLNLCFGALMIACALTVRRPEERRQDEDLWLFVLLGAASQAMMGLYRIVRVADVGEYERFFATSLWALFAIGLLVLAESRRDQLLAKSAVFVLMVAAGKGLLFDVSANQPVVRIVCMLVLGSALYLSGYLLRRASAWTTPGRDRS